MLQLTVRFENKKVIKSTLLINVRTLKNYSLSYVIFNIFLSLKMIFSSGKKIELDEKVIKLKYYDINLM